jgi:Glyoxalase-like domain
VDGAAFTRHAAGRRLAVARFRDVTIDCAHPASLARFWAAALDGYAVAPYDEAELARLRAAGINDPEDDPGVIVEAVTGPRLYFQLVPEPKAGKNRLHLDICCENVGSEVARLTGLGARQLSEQHTWVVMADPEGNEFCVTQG